MIYSAWKLTYDPSGTPQVLVDYGQLIDDELDAALKKAVEVVSLVDAAAPFIRVGKNAVVNFSVRVLLETAATDTAARVAVLNSLVAAQTATRKPLRIEVSGHTTDYWQFANATVEGHTPRRHLDSPFPATLTQWDIVATGLTKTAVTPPP